MKKIVALVLCICMLTIGLVGCGSGSDYSNSRYLGTWTATTCEYDGFEMNVEDIVGEFTITLNADGTFTAVVGEENQDGTWEETDLGIKLDGDEEMEFTDNDGILSLDYEEVLMNFEQQ